MTTKTSLLSLILFCTTRLFAQSPTCNCETNFKWVKTTFEKNDAGFQYIIQQKGMDAYRKHTAAFLPKIKQTSDKQLCADLMNQWLLFFRKAHFWVAPIDPQASSRSGKSSKPWPSLDIPESQIKDRSAEPNANPWTGIWQTGAYTLGIFSHQGSFKGIILQSANPAWKPGQVKLNIEKNGAGDFYMGDRTPQHFTKATLIGKNGLKLGSIDLTRTFPVFKEDEKEALYVKEMSAGNPFIEKLSDKTILFRIPSFDGSQKPLIDSLIAVYDQTLRQTENLVIDIRDNGGGDDDSYEKILPYIYTNPIRMIPFDLYSTPLNNKRMEDYLSIPNLSENSKKQVYAALKKLNDHLGQFVGFNEDV